MIIGAVRVARRPRSTGSRSMTRIRRPPRDESEIGPSLSSSGGCYPAFDQRLIITVEDLGSSGLTSA
jgi:hypothetical protein